MPKWVKVNICKVILEPLETESRNAGGCGDMASVGRQSKSRPELRPRGIGVPRNFASQQS